MSALYADWLLLSYMQMHLYKQYIDYFSSEKTTYICVYIYIYLHPRGVALFLPLLEFLLFWICSVSWKSAALLGNPFSEAKLELPITSDQVTSDQAMAQQHTHTHTPQIKFFWSRCWDCSMVSRCSAFAILLVVGHACFNSYCHVGMWHLNDVGRKSVLNKNMCHPWPQHCVQKSLCPF